MLGPRMWIARRVLATLASIGAAAAFQVFDGHAPAALWLPTALLAICAALQFHRHLGSQLLVRAVWWSNLLLGTLLATSGGSTEREIGGAIALATGAALLAVGRRGLEDSGSGGFTPIAYRGSLMGIVVMAVADAQSLFLFGALQVTEHKSWHASGVATLPLWLGAAMIAGIAGIYRLKLWGLVLNLAANAAVILAAASGVLDLPGPLLWAYGVTSALQIALALPLVLALFRGAAPSARKPSRASLVVTAGAIGAMMALSAYCAFVLRSAIWRI
ncbi:MAG TPA: hypothetical protein VFF06_10240 [Polyangia bacterium]|nr:hypothetical protein [Polyangia bacterium]